MHITNILCKTGEKNEALSSSAVVRRCKSTKVKVEVGWDGRLLYKMMKTGGRKNEPAARHYRRFKARKGRLFTHLENP